jgi:uncharacterized coiled-coil protein SlyX
MDGETVDSTARRATVGTVEAGRALGVKPDSIRARLRRGSLQGFQDEAGEWQVYADQLAAGRARYGPRRRGHVAQDATGDMQATRVAVLEAQLAAITDERDNLRQLAARQAEAVNEAAARLAALAERFARLQLQAPADAAAGLQAAPGAPQEGVQAAGASLASTMLAQELRGLRVALERQRRPWWRRIIGR